MFAVHDGTKARLEHCKPFFDEIGHEEDNRASNRSRAILSVMDQANILIIGGGVVGCAIAEAFPAIGKMSYLVEQYPRFGMATSTRNSGVIHSGIYYHKNSLKARLCVSGNHLTKEFCKKHNVPCTNHRKLVVAKDLRRARTDLAPA